MFFLAGSVVVLVCVLGGFAMSGGNLLLLWHPIEIVVIVGAALGAFMTSNTPKVAKKAFGGAMGLIKGPRFTRADYADLLKLIYDILMKLRKDGVLALESEIEKPYESKLFANYPRILADHHMVEFITDCLRLMSGGNMEAHELESLL